MTVESVGRQCSVYFILLLLQTWQCCYVSSTTHCYIMSLAGLYIDILQCLPLLLLVVGLHVNGSNSAISVQEDILSPYQSEAGRHRSHRHVRSVQPAHFNDVTNSLYPSDQGAPFLRGESFAYLVGDEWMPRYVSARVFRVGNPVRSLSVLPPSGGCGNNSRATVRRTAADGHCLVALNAGFFNTTSDSCLGNLVSEGIELLNADGIQNANFGIKKDGSLFFGYLADNEWRLSQQFDQLVSGVIWLVRDSQSYVTVSKAAECADTQETGSLDYFASVQSARSAIGHDKQGRIILLQVEGKTGTRGVNLYEMADLLIQLGAVNAINLDGGGSSTIVEGGIVLNVPSDVREENGFKYSVPREVSSIICVHAVRCSPPHCNDHGRCVNGQCVCQGKWTGRMCDRLWCGSFNCRPHGNCTQAGCVCDPGWQGSGCQFPCSRGTYGLNCTRECRCQNRGTCDPVDGTCTCLPGYTGVLCEKECEPGYYGRGCRQLCYCDNACTCHHVTGSCNVTIDDSSPQLQVGQCLANQIVRDRYIILDHQQQYKLWLFAIITLCVVSAVSITINISLLCITRCPTTGQGRIFDASLAVASSCATSDSELNETALPLLRNKDDNT